MFLGGEITWDPTQAKNSISTGDTTLDEAEMKQGLNVDDPTTVDDNTIVYYNNKKYTWAELKQIIRQAMQAKQGGVPSGGNLSPGEVNAAIQALLQPVHNLSGEIEDFINELQGLESDAEHAKGDDKDTVEQAIRQKRDNLRQKQTQLRKAIEDARKKGVSNESVEEYRNSLRSVNRRAQAGAPRAAGSEAPRGNGSGGGNGKGGTGKAQGQQGGNGNGFGVPGFGSGSTPPSSAAYASALYMDSIISDGLGNLFKSRREGQKLMMLFFYFARMAESGDLGAMYQLMKFVNYVIAKDKARQNIKISSKLIQLQDLSRKSTELLMQTPTDGDPSQVNEFTKAMHRARSQEQSISTSQKLLADMLQEFAHVVEALTNSTKFMLDAWGRVMRTATRP